MYEPLDPPCSNDLQIESRAEEAMQVMLEDDRYFVERQFYTDVYDIEEDVALKVYENSGDEIVKLLAMMLQAHYTENKSIKTQKEADYAEQLTVVKMLAHKQLTNICEEIAKKEIGE